MEDKNFYSQSSTLHPPFSTLYFLSFIFLHNLTTEIRSFYV
jgi:hypothetical protein